MCAAWSRLQNLNVSRHPPGWLENLRLQARVHLEFCAQLYRDQLEAGRYFLHENPAGAVSWKEAPIVALATCDGVACATMGRYLYVAGGARPDYWEPEHQACCDTNRLSRLDTSTGEWVELAPMHNVRRNFCLVAYGGYLYAVGGQENVHDTEYFNYLSSDDEIPPVEDYECEF